MGFLFLFSLAFFFLFFLGVHQTEWLKGCLDALTSAEKVNDGKDYAEIVYNKAVQVSCLLIWDFKLHKTVRIVKTENLLNKMTYSLPEFL